MAGSLASGSGRGRKAVSEPLRLLPMRIPAGWAVRHNRLVDAPVDHPLWDHFGTLLLACNAESDLLLELAWNPKIGRTGRFLLRIFAGSQYGESLHRFDTGDAAAIVAEAERLMDALVTFGLASDGERRYTQDDMVTLFHLCSAMARQGALLSQYGALVADKMVALAPLLEPFYNSLPGTDQERIGDFEEDFIPQALDLFDWTSPQCENEAMLLARLTARFRGSLT